MRELVAGIKIKNIYQIKNDCIECSDVKQRGRRTPDAQLSPSLFTSLAPRIQRASMATYSSLSAQDRLPLLPTRRLRFDFLHTALRWEAPAAHSAGEMKKLLLKEASPPPRGDFLNILGQHFNVKLDL